MNRSHLAWLILACLSAVSVARAESPPSFVPPAGHLDEAEFRDALQQRGLNVLLDRYLRDVPPVDEVDAALRKREEILRQLESANRLPGERRALIQQASNILRELLRERPQHQATLKWRYELARDLLERTEPAAFDRVLLNELPGRDADVVRQLTTQAIADLRILREDLAVAWKQLGQLDERTLTRQANVTTASWQELDQSSALLLAWARVFLALADVNEAASQQTPWSQLLDEVIQKQRWHLLGDGQEPRRATALLLAAISSRQLRQFDTADSYARQVVATINQIADPVERRSLSKLALAAVLEQIRTLRDAGRREEALQSIEQARQWLNKSRAQDYSAAVALTLVEYRVLIPSAAVATQPVPPSREMGRVLGTFPAALAPLQRLAEQSPEHRDALYMALGPVLAHEPIPHEPTLFTLQLLLGATVAETVADDANQPIASELLHAVREAIERGNARSATMNVQSVQAELSYLLGRALAITGQNLEAARILTDLAEQYPKSDRAIAAVQTAVNLCQQQLRLPENANTADFCTVFAHAGRLLQQLEPDRKENQALSYYMALALEKVGERTEALNEYSQVPAEDPNALRAALGQTRVLLAMLPMETATSTAPVNVDTAQMLDVTARATDRALQATASDQRCVAVEILVNRAILLNHPRMNQPAEALDLLDRWSSRSDCSEMQPRLLQQRIESLVQLHRLAEARQTAEQLFQVEPPLAGATISRLMQALTTEIEAADDRGEMPMMRELAAEGVRAAELMRRWYEQSPDVGSAAVRACRLWHARCLVTADRAEDALPIYLEGAATTLPTDSPLHTEQTLGRAECLLALGRSAEALPLFAQIWQSTPEHSIPWWRAFVGSLRAHAAMHSDPQQIVQSIRQQKQLEPDLGAPRFKRALEQLEQGSLALATSQPAAPTKN